MTDFDKFMQDLLQEEIPIRVYKQRSVYLDEWKPAKEFPVLHTSWTSGGITGGNCWGDSADVSMDGEPEPLFKALDDVLTMICPKITFLQYRALEHAVIHRDEVTHGEYYGNETRYGIKYVDLKELYDYLVEKKLLAEPERCIDMCASGCGGSCGNISGHLGQCECLPGQECGA